MTFNRLTNSLTLIPMMLFSSVFLNACEGIFKNNAESGSNNSTAADTVQPDEQASVTPASLEVAVESTSPVIKPSVPEADIEININTVENKSYESAGLAGSQLISRERSQCGLAAVTQNDELTKIANQHAHYIQHVLAKSAPTLFNVHHENGITNIKEWTGTNNPFFTGISMKERLLAAKYPRNYSVVENISHTTYYNSVGKVVSPELAAEGMVKSLLAAPYHLSSLMIPSLAKTGTSVVAYTPYGKDVDTYQSYVLVNNSATSHETENISFKGIFTYPCDGVTDTNTALYNESPNPVEGTNRNLSTNPIGQPIYISMPTANSISVSNIKFYDIQRDIEVPTDLLDYRDDPHKNTAYELLKNEAFILPLTDRFKSCESGRRQGKNCGLYGNSAYRVSFEVLVDGKILEKKQFTFTTGNVN
ncbi:CAP domain-containing protein [Psychrobacter frigidicola]|uniref:CAP domain-containing protein n=1 Tax=Psychrobacter frigidicola TaxID=45611 RepID=A0A5C7A3N9_9GAMM|nr:CAP domain-containing protein [Psychrobacter frigidicola]TXD98039.1 CAP domain-containing protein [Psychrobacter frigidicola]